MLYLSGFLMVGGLLFLSALLHWPSFYLEPDAVAAYRSHAQSLVLYYSVSCSLLIASFYVPVAARLNHGETRARSRPDSDDEHTPLSVRELLQVAAAIFSPLLVGLLGEIMNLPS